MSGKGELERMYVAESFLLRASIVLGMVAAVVTILYFSPMPDNLFKSCDRPCHDLDWPMICRVKLTIESYKKNSDDCGQSNQTDCDNSTEGLITAFLATNNLLPGPSIQVCQNDVLVVDVVNKLPGHGVSIHWRGQPQKEAPFMDGTPMITQCPINSYTTFQYRFRASAEGTHLWHAHSGAELADGIFGALVVRRAPKLDPQRKLYDYDDKKHVVLISEWSGSSATNLSSHVQKPKSLLINGKGTDAPYIFEVRHGKRYRFRVAHGGGVGECAVRVSIEEHQVNVISLDGSSVNPYLVDSVELAKGERVDFVLKASKDYSQYKMKVSSLCGRDGVKLETYAMLVYVGGTQSSRKFIGARAEDKTVFTTKPCEGVVNTLCLSEVQAMKKMPNLLTGDVDRTFYFAFDYTTIDKHKDANKVFRMNNITFTYPPSPLLTQMDDVPEEKICNSAVQPSRCERSEICECTHVEDINLGETVELILMDGGSGNEENNFHLHGYKFYVVGSRIFESPPSLGQIRNLDAKGSLFKRNLGSPVQKDTIRIPRNGVVALRFTANNPGFWMLRDGNANQWTRGADVVFHVGSQSDLPAAPASFPTCGSWVGPDFFLL